MSLPKVMCGPICQSLVIENPPLHSVLSKLIHRLNSWTTFLNLPYFGCTAKKEKINNEGHIKVNVVFLDTTLVTTDIHYLTFIFQKLPQNPKDYLQNP